MPTLVIGLTGLLILAGCVGVPRDGSADEKGIIQHEMLKAAQAGEFQSPPAGHHYEAPVECRIDLKRKFNDVYLCKISISDLPSGHLYERAAWVNRTSSHSRERSFEGARHQRQL